MMDSDKNNCTQVHCVDGWCRNVTYPCNCMMIGEDRKCAEQTDLTYTSYLLAAVLSFVGSLLILGCVIASVHYAKYAYRYWCLSCHRRPIKKTSSMLSITSTTYVKSSSAQPTAPVREQRSDSLQLQTVIIAHPLTTHPMTVLCGESPPPYAISVTNSPDPTGVCEHAPLTPVPGQLTPGPLTPAPLTPASAKSTTSHAFVFPPRLNV